MSSSNHTNSPGRIRRFWRALSQPSRRFAAGTLLLAGLIVGALGWQGFNTVVAHTNTVEFCTSCHAMEAYVYPVYAESTHYSNASGVRVTCADCHVPEAFFPKMFTKIRATVVEVPRHIIGKINTEESFEAHKLELAERVWDRMSANDSRECRGCHSWEAMSEERQDRFAQRRHSLEYREATGNMTCIDCHKGIAHELPADM